MAFGSVAQLQGAVTFSNTPPTVQWKQYSGPGTVTFGNAAQTNTMATFSAPGIYTLMLSAADGIHAVAYDAVVITVSGSISLSITHTATNFTLAWNGGSPPYVVQQANTLHPASWTNILTTSNLSATFPISSTNSFFRVQGQ